MAKILDCTLRDGGYQNGWNFSDRFVEHYLDAMRAASVDVVELGFRHPVTGLGPYWSTTDGLLDTFNLEGLTVAVMVNASELLRPAALERLFPPAGASPVDMVRIACHPDEVDRILPHAVQLRQRGYEVAINRMQATEMTGGELARFSEQTYNAGALAYLADSLGRASGPFIDRALALFGSRAGFHPHNNRGLAVVNALAAISVGTAMVDTTVAGIGRGAGNAALEELLAELRRPEDAAAVERFAAEYIPPETRRWGPSPAYRLAARLRVHPTYVQAMEDHGVKGPRLLEAIAALEGRARFDAETFNPRAYL